MPGTLFSKLNLLLVECNANPALPIDDLAARILEKGYYEFQVSRRVGEDLVQEPSHPATVRRMLYTLSDLGLMVINGGCTLSGRGKDALKDYPNVLGQALLEYLQKVYGVSLVAIKDGILRVKMQRGSDVPSAGQIFQQLLAARAFKQPMNEERFSTFLNLLSRCGVIHSYIKKYYW